MIYHLSVSAISRGKGRSVCAAAAYRTASIICDDHYGVTHDYGHKSGVIYSGVVGYPITQGEIQDELRAKLWNAAEAAERRRDAVVGREVRFALPHACGDGLRVVLVESYSRFLSQKYGVAVESAIHAPSRKGDPRNYHAHLLFTARPVDPVTGKFARLKDRRWNGAEYSKTLLDVRKEWADIYNEFARFAELPEISHLSNRARGIKKEPSKHMGPARTALKRNGISLECDDPSFDQCERERMEEERIKHSTEMLETEKQLDELYHEELEDELFAAEVEEAGGLAVWEEWRRISDLFGPDELFEGIAEIPPEPSKVEESVVAEEQPKSKTLKSAEAVGIDEAEDEHFAAEVEEVGGFAEREEWRRVSDLFGPDELFEEIVPGWYLGSDGNRYITDEGARRLFTSFNLDDSIPVAESRVEEQLSTNDILNKLPPLEETLESLRRSILWDDEQCNKLEDEPSSPDLLPPQLEPDPFDDL
ncbi:MobA/MobL family protein [Coraliomargarita sp. SDUM461004]|uniref:MobA/MobL family protein n=1 Tax=Thalassobacterium sedimentorum TaxID=3041258 RepID=A0ABU1AFQ4_9BACT|nr:MobA/MobL family protein [Coraliomargarita sp. SDUM461004]MDQ8193661.1 MobA/MobL family protein [Coraliomargarita sp. SDUM461004]